MLRGFRPVRTIWGGPVPAPEPIVLAASVTVSVGDVVKLINGGVDAADAVNDRIYGVCVGFVTPKGLSYDQDPASFDGTYTQAIDGDTYAAAADNQTDKKIRALVVPIDGVILSAKLDAAKGTTATSDVVGNYLSVLTTDSTQLDESTVVATVEQFLIVGFDPQDQTRPLVRVVEHQTYL